MADEQPSVVMAAGKRKYCRTGLKREPGESAADWKRRRMRATMARWRESNNEKEDARRRELYRLNGPGDAKRAWTAANKDKVAAYSRAHFDRNREEKLGKLLAWRDADPARAKALSKAWFAKNPEKYTAYMAKHRAKVALAVPLWVDWKAIDKIYYQAKKLTKKTGIEHQVDHIVPLNHPDVCGLHVPWNLQILTKAENLAKSNKFTPSLLQHAA
jgi:5-methylcytosine-specific restriction endonuclease McrA